MELAPEPDHDEHAAKLAAAVARWPDHPSVDQHAADPSAVAGTDRRMCVAATVAGPRCTSPAITGTTRCSAHAGRLDSAAGGNARAARLAEAREEARERDINSRLGARAALARQLRDDQRLLTAALHTLLEAAAGGDLNAAKALPAFLNQALGMPSAPVDIEVSAGNVETLSTAQLASLLGRSQHVA